MTAPLHRAIVDTFMSALRLGERKGVSVTYSHTDFLARSKQDQQVVVSSADVFDFMRQLKRYRRINPRSMK